MPRLLATLHLHAIERPVTISDLERWTSRGALLETFCTGTAVTVASVGRIGLDRVSEGPESQKYKGLVWLESRRMGPIAKGLHEGLAAIQTGKLQMDESNFTNSVGLQFEPRMHGYPGETRDSFCLRYAISSSDWTPNTSCCYI